MHRIDPLRLKREAFVILLLLTATVPALAQTRLTLPAGSVVLVRTDQDLSSATTRSGATFTTTVLEAVSVNGYTLIPVNSRIRGVVSYVQPASSKVSGVMQVDFDRFILPNGTSVPIVGRLTSTDSAERRQIESRADSRVVFHGGRSGPGAAIAGAGSRSSSAAGILAALSGMLSEGRDAVVPAGTQIAVQLAQSVTLNAIGSANLADASTIFTAADRIRSAQEELARRGYYRGALNGQLDIATRRALFDFQAGNNITPTGNLTGRTARALGIIDDANARSAGILSARSALALRDAANALTARQRSDLGISADGRVGTSRTLSPADLELLFAFSAFAANATLYEQLVRVSGRTGGVIAAGRALLSSGRRVDDALRHTRPSSSVQNVWLSVRQQLEVIGEL